MHRSIIGIALVSLHCATDGCAAAETKTANYTVRIVTLNPLEIPAARAAMLCAPGEENMLLEELAPDMGSPVSDIILKCSGSGSSIDAISETPYATEHGVNTEWRQMVPNSFTFRNVGTGARASIQPASPTEPAILDYYWNRTRYAGRKPFPILTVKTFMPAVQPIFFTEIISGRLSVANGQWRLAGMTRPIELNPDTTNPRRTLMTFVKVWDGSSAPATPAPPAEGRLHLLAFRVPMQEGIEMARRPAGSDAALLENLLERAESGGISLAGHAACLTSRGANSASDSENNSPADPLADVSDRGQASKAESIHEDAYATEYNPDPTSFSFRNAGSSLTVSPRDKKRAGSVPAIYWESLASTVKQLPLSPHLEGASMTAPEYSPEVLDIQTDLPPGFARMVGAMLLPDDGGPRMMRIYFLQSAGQAPKSEATASGFSEIHAALISLPAADGLRLSSADPDKQWAGVETLLQNNTARILAWQGVAGKSGTRAAAKLNFETPSTGGFNVKRAAGGLLFPTGSTFFTLGNNLDLHLPGSAAPSDGKFTVTLDKPELASLEEYNKAAQDGTKLPGLIPTKLSFPADGEKFPTLTPDGPRVVSLAPSTARAGHAEHGRWHAVMMLLGQE